MFFPTTPGKKPTRAREFCAGCPVQDWCLSEKLEDGGPGFQCGTTEAQRTAMKQFKVSTEFQVRTEYERNLPVVAAGPRALKLIRFEERGHDWMDSAEPDPAVLNLLDNVEPTSTIWDLVS